ncbi:chromosome partition protein Smc [Geomicrobium sp. JCM 19055]|nr:chromosome partition protein Smc [Geomicrobium sp. JCM 19055]
MKRRMDTLDEEYSGAKDSLEAKQTNFDHLQQQIESLETKKQTVLEDVEESKQHVEKIQEHKQKQSDHLHRGYRSYEDVKARIDLLERMEQEHAGFFQGVKAVMQGRDHGQLSGVLGPVASLIHATKKFELAIETALGGALQHIVVDTDQNGRKAIAYLKAKKARKSNVPTSKCYEAKVCSIEYVKET